MAGTAAIHTRVHCAHADSGLSAVSNGSPLFQPGAPEDWRDWIAEAQRIVESWESATNRRLLTAREAGALIERIARALHVAFERARNSPL